MFIRSISLVCVFALALVGCSDPQPTGSVDSGTGGSDMASDSATVLDAASDAASDATSGDAAVFTDGGVFADADVDGPLVSCVDSCGEGRCETRVRLRAQCLAGEAEMSSCTTFVADFSCHDAGF